jgi:Uma2 family endonuclease
MLTLELPPRKMQTAFNLRRWTELLSHPGLAKVEGRIETDRHGHIIWTLPAFVSHGSLQLEIGCLIHSLVPLGRVLTECPISTADGVKAADGAWASPDCIRELGQRPCFIRSPEICVEVLSPSNTNAEIQEKMALYFDAGAKEVWICSQNGGISFHSQGAARPMRASKLCPQFPRQIEPR